MRSTGRRGVRRSFSTPRSSTYTLCFEGNASLFCSLARSSCRQGNQTAYLGVDPHLGATRQRLSIPKQTFLHREESVRRCVRGRDDTVGRARSGRRSPTRFSPPLMEERVPAAPRRQSRSARRRRRPAALTPDPAPSTEV